MYKKPSAILASIFLLTLAVFTVAWSAPPTLEQTDIETNESVREGKVVSVKAKVGSSNGGPAIQLMKVDHPRGAVLQVDASLTVGEGHYKIELLDKGNPSLILEVKKGQTKKGKGRMTVNENGEVQYRVTADKAKNISFELAFMSVKAEKSSQPSAKTSKTLSEDDYKAVCQQVPINDLTKSADRYKGRKVRYTGQIVVFESSEGAGAGKTTSTRLILSVKDDAKSLPSGALPLFVAYQGETDSFINDTVTAYGEVYGNYDYESVRIKKKTLPRIDARYLEKAP